MIARPDSLFARPEIAAVLAAELSEASLHAAHLAAGEVLLIQPDAGVAGMAADFGDRPCLRLHVRGEALVAPARPVDIAMDAWPWADEAFRLVIVQHAGDVLGDESGLLAEAVRVTAIGGSLLWFGLNRWNPWFAWTRWQAANARAHSSGRLRRRLASESFAVSDRLLRFGGGWPGADGVAAQAWPDSLCCAWGIAAVRQQATPTAIAPPLFRAQVALRPDFAMSRRRLPR